jgi:hypothetical protein
MYEVADLLCQLSGCELALRNFSVRCLVLYEVVAVVNTPNF